MIAIVLATYNGQKYLREQIDSIRAQTVGEWTLFVSDDSSTDGTLEILRQYARDDRRIQVLAQPSRRLGPTTNFARLLNHAAEAGAQYVAFADQDDVWLSTKLALQLDRIRAIEKAAGRSQPALVHTDAQVVDTALNPIADSRHRFSHSRQQAHLEANAMGRLLLHAFVQGCTSIINRPLLDFVVPVPAAAVSHDWWCSLCAAAIGTIEYISQPTLKYRQHANNCIGAQHGGPFSIAKRIFRNRDYWRNGMATFVQSLCQSSALADRLQERGSGNAPVAASIDKYCRVMQGEGTRLGRIWKLRRLQIPDVDWLRTLGSYARVMLLPENIRRQLRTAGSGPTFNHNVSSSNNPSIVTRPITVNGGIR